jgi:hypothetical protein
MTYWPTSEGTCSIQIGSIPERDPILAIEGRRIAYAVAGPWVEVWEVARTLPWIRTYLSNSEAKEVYGGDWSAFYGSEPGNAASASRGPIQAK